MSSCFRYLFFCKSLLGNCQYYLMSFSYVSLLFGGWTFPFSLIFWVSLDFHFFGWGFNRSSVRRNAPLEFSFLEVPLPFFREVRFFLNFLNLVFFSRQPPPGFHCSTLYSLSSPILQRLFFFFDHFHSFPFLLVSRLPFSLCSPPWALKPINSGCNRI